MILATYVVGGLALAAIVVCLIAIYAMMIADSLGWSDATPARIWNGYEEEDVD